MKNILSVMGAVSLMASGGVATYLYMNKDNKSNKVKHSE